MPNPEEIARTMGKACRAHLIELYKKHGFTEEDIEFPPMYVDGVDATAGSNAGYANDWIIETLLAKIDAQQRIISAQQIDLTHKLERLRATKADNAMLRDELERPWTCQNCGRTESLLDETVLDTGSGEGC